MTEQTPTPEQARPPLRFHFVYDEDHTLDGIDGRPLPESPEVYAGNEHRDLINPADDPVTGARRIVPYAEYVQYYGNPDRHVVLGAIVERQCPCCESWLHAGSLWGIDFMDDSPEVAAVSPRYEHDRKTCYYTEAEALALPGYLGSDVIPGLISEARS